MTVTDRTGPALRVYLAGSRLIPLVAPALLRRRLARGKEDGDRWREKLGHPTAPRPDGTLVWLHAVGLGEVMALRGLIAAMATARPDWSFLVTSTARSSAGVLAHNLPPRTRHQFLPLDAPRYLARFLDHWRPDLSVWAEQDIWPGAVVASARRGIPLALVNARMDAGGLARRRRVRGLYADLLGRFALIEAQDAATATHLSRLGGADVAIGTLLKAGNAPLAADPADLARLRSALGDRAVWLLASSHPADEATALAAQAGCPRRLIVVPRDADRGVEIAGAARAAGLTAGLASRGDVPGAAEVFVDDAYGRLGLWYRIADIALIGGSFGGVGGHNPWEAAVLGCAVLHGPDVGNFAADYVRLDAAGACRPVTGDTLAAALADGPGAMGQAGRAAAREGQGAVAALADRLIALARGPA